MNNRSKKVRKVIPEMRSQQAAAAVSKSLTAAELRRLLAEAEANEKSELEFLRREVQVLRQMRGLDEPVASPRASALEKKLPEVLSIAEAALALRVSVPTIRNWVRAGKIEAGQARKGGRVLLSRDAVLAILSIRPS